MRRVSMGMLLGVALLATPALADDTRDRDSSSGSTWKRQGALLDRSAQRRPHMLSFFLGVPVGYWYYAGFPIGIGGRYMLPILHDGFAPALNDSFGLEFGADFSGVAGSVFYALLGIPVEVYYMLHFTPRFAAYAKVGVALEIGFTRFCNTAGICYGGGVGVQPIGNLGLTYKIGDSFFFRAEAGYPWVKVGFGFGL